MKLIKVRFLRNGVPSGRPYTYETPVPVKVDDIVQISVGSLGIVTETDVDEAEVAAFRDKLKTIIGLVEKEENTNTTTE